jgi:nucleoside-diphosphate-sugar epimerase
LVTGAAGFIGSTLVDRLLLEGHEVIGIDSFTPYYDRSQKYSNVASAVGHKRFKLQVLDLSTDNLEGLLDGISDVFHQAGQPGVRASWGSDFREYVAWNILGTQRLLESARTSSTVESFVAASSSSVYGFAESFPTSELCIPRPISPYGVTKLASEHLCSLYREEFGVPTVSLRYFTVFGPRQRPDMAISRMVDACINNQEFTMFGDGTQERDFTYVDDVVQANLLAAQMIKETGDLSPVFNIGGNTPVSMKEVAESVQRIVGKELRVEHVVREHGDPKATGADTERASKELNWLPKIDFQLGIRRQVEYQQSSVISKEK